MAARYLLLYCLALFMTGYSHAQSAACTFKPPFLLIHFGSGNIQDINATSLALYRRVSTTCPNDGYYSYTSHTSDCFRGDWHTLNEDHTPGDVAGNMLLVNSAYDKGVFFTTHVKGFKAGTVYQFGVWLINVCKPSDKCPYPLLPNIIIRLITPSGRNIGQFITGELPRTEAPEWKQYRAQFTVPSSETEFLVIMSDEVPGGCGNDFAVDDISFSECVKSVQSKIEKSKSVTTLKKKQPLSKNVIRKDSALQKPTDRVNHISTISGNEKVLVTTPHINGSIKAEDIVPVPLVLKERTNPLIRHIEADAGEIEGDLYDNGIIDGDTISVYHNNKMIISQQRLTEKPISFHIQLDKDHPHHEFIMVANNLGSIPPNTSLMIIRTKEKRYEVFISTTEQQNAKVVIDLKQ